MTSVVATCCTALGVSTRPDGAPGRNLPGDKLSKSKCRSWPKTDEAVEAFPDPPAPARIPSSPPTPWCSGCARRPRSSKIFIVATGVSAEELPRHQVTSMRTGPALALNLVARGCRGRTSDAHATTVTAIGATCPQRPGGAEPTRGQSRSTQCIAIAYC